LVTPMFSQCQSKEKQPSTTEYYAKALVAGDYSSGKTCLMVRYVKDEFSLTQPSSIGIDFAVQKIEVDKTKVMVQIWDTPGQERLHQYALSYFDKSQGIILTYAIDDRRSFESIDKWMAEIKKSASKDVAVVLVGTKADLESSRSVSFFEGKMMAEKYNIKFFEASSKDNINVGKVFEVLAKEIKDVQERKEKEWKEKNEDELERLRIETNLFVEPLKKRSCFRAIFEKIKSIFKKKKKTVIVKSKKERKVLKEAGASMQVLKKSRASYSSLINQKRGQ